MPELPDITVYIDALQERIVGARLLNVRVFSPFLLRTTDPDVKAAIGLTVRDLRRLGKRIAIGFDEDLWCVIHLMVAGRFHWKDRAPVKPTRNILAVFEFDNGVLTLTEAGTKRRASLHMVRGEDGLKEQDPGGLEVLEADCAAFATAVTRRNHTLKRALTDPKILSGIGNTYSDEILHRAGLSPVALTSTLTDEQIQRLYKATQETLTEWIQRLRRSRGFPEKVTAFRPEMAVHGRFGKPCPVCGTTVQRILYASNEANYCPRCQTDGKLLADRSLSRLLKKDWPRSIEELEKTQQERE